MSKPTRTGLIAALSSLAVVACAAPTGDSVEGSEGPDLNRAMTLSVACSGCHSDRLGAIASLASYTQATMQERLTAYKSETTGTTVMHRLARGYSDEEIALISAYLGQTGEPT